MHSESFFMPTNAFAARALLGTSLEVYNTFHTLQLYLRLEHILSVFFFLKNVLQFLKFVVLKNNLCSGLVFVICI